jgi:hypothetical protein
MAKKEANNVEFVPVDRCWTLSIFHLTLQLDRLTTPHIALTTPVI